MMKHALVALAIAFSATSPASPQPKTGESTAMKATGTFDVKVTPQPGEFAFPRLTIDKTFHGDLEGTSKGEMMSVESTVEGSGAYVAIERIHGSVKGRKGSFSVIHNGTMKRGGDFRLVIHVVPDSGTDELTGISGTMQIVIAEGKHSYVLEFELAP
jgi:hypothetical protein